MYVCYLQEHDRRAVFWKKGACLQTKELVLLVGYKINLESIGKEFTYIVSGVL